MIEVLLAQFILIYSYPKRKYFPVRIIPACAACLFLSSFIGEKSMTSIMSNPDPATIFAVSFGRFFLMAVVTVIGMLLSFDASVGSVISACMGGMAIQHIGYHLSVMVGLIPVFSKTTVNLEIICCLVLTAVLYFLLGRKLARTNYYKNYDKRMIMISVVILFISIIVYRLSRIGNPENIYLKLCISVYAVMSCSLALFIQFFMYRYARLLSSYNMQMRISEEERKQYKISKENINLINIKCHDLKHILENYGEQIPKNEVEGILKNIEDYDAFFKTGQPVLDVILNEKNIRCRNYGISMTFLGNGPDIDFMSTMDTYSMFSNAIENAVTALKKLDDASKKVISITMKRKGDFIYIQFRNYFTGDLLMDDGLPVTTKTEETGFHGFGLKSIRMIAEKYGGGVAITAEDDIFNLEIYLLSSNE